MIALDTNVLVYACDKADPARQQTALDLIWNTEVACCCGKSRVNSSRHRESSNRQGFTSIDAWSRLVDFLEMFELVIAAGSRVLDRAKHLHLNRNVAFWDAMIIAACLDAGVRRLYSEDLPGDDIEGLSIRNPFK